MSSDDRPTAGEEPRHAGFTESLAPPPLEGPLHAFRPDEDTGDGAPVYLGGDLHAVHPLAIDRHPDHVRDPTLDQAKITLVDGDDERPGLQADAAEGIWCLRIDAEFLPAAPCFLIHDSRGRVRAWLLIPSARQMIGIGHLWLSAVAPFPPSFGADAGQTARPDGSPGCP